MGHNCGVDPSTAIPSEVRELIAAAFADADRARDRARSLVEMAKVIYGIDDEARFRLSIQVIPGQGIGSPDQASGV